MGVECRESALRVGGRESSCPCGGSWPRGRAPIPETLLFRFFHRHCCQARASGGTRSPNRIAKRPTCSIISKHFSCSPGATKRSRWRSPRVRGESTANSPEVAVHNSRRTRVTVNHFGSDYNLDVLAAPILRRLFRQRLHVNRISQELA